MGDLRNKAKKDAEREAIRDRERRVQEGWTIFYFDFNPKLTRRNLSPGEAVRYLERMTNTKTSLWRCPVRGLAVQFEKHSTTSTGEPRMEIYRSLHFSKLENEREAKMALCEDLLLLGIEMYRGLPNKVLMSGCAPCIGYLPRRPAWRPKTGWR
jgi:hypothetical protein